MVNVLLFTLFCCCRGSCCYLHLPRRSASGPSQLFGPAFRRFLWILKNLLKVDQPFAVQRVFTTHWISQRAFSSVTVLMWLHQPEFFTCLLSVSDQKRWHSSLQKPFRHWRFHLHLGNSWFLSNPSDLQHRIQLIIDVHAVYDAMQEIVRLSDIEQLHENVIRAEKHTPDDKEQFHLRIHHDVLIPRSITMYSTFLPLPFHSLLLQIVNGRVTSSHRSLFSPVLHLHLMTCLPLCGRRVFTDCIWPYSLWLLSTTSLKLTVNSSVAIFAVSSATFFTMFWSFLTPLWHNEEIFARVESIEWCSSPVAVTSWNSLRTRAIHADSRAPHHWRPHFKRHS